jgi:hypothetical protein
MRTSSASTRKTSSQDELQYRGRRDASRMTPAVNVRRDLFEAMNLDEL